MRKESDRSRHEKGREKKILSLSVMHNRWGKKGGKYFPLFLDRILPLHYLPWQARQIADPASVTLRRGVSAIASIGLVNVISTYNSNH